MSAIILTPKKIARLLFTEQLKWSIWFLSFMFVIYIGFLIFSGDSIASFIDVVHFSNGSISIYLFVIGILAMSTFFRYYINLGATRKNFFLGVIASSMLLTIAITVIITFLSFVIHFIAGTPSILDMANIRSSNLLDSILTLLQFFISSVMVYMIYYLMGWMISLTFYRSSWLYGLLSIAAAIVIAGITGFLWEGTHISFFSHISDLPVLVSILLSLLIIGLLFTINYRLIKDVTVKM
ncbi:hypothetical protein [Oceanobacillus sp. J11TS1]|uniref:hypothetical protein n=1 Tax=Oceanobacillus sp. J11TS1 TaxID=2807191 RepID=UPI001B0332FD|nr:hypothetical protein [Oceanobacillus sp. J11TS1]GIO23348.1 hypothetical protein J11TS1_19290 [Oceanobacillus sp. J11TS1]